MGHLAQRCKHVKLPGTIITSSDELLIVGYDLLPTYAQQVVLSALAETGYIPPSPGTTSNLSIPLDHSSRALRLECVGRALNLSSVIVNNSEHKRISAASRSIQTYSEAIDIDNVLDRAERLAHLLHQKTEEIAIALGNYETYNVVLDEVARSVDLLNNLAQNCQYFQRKVNGVTTFLPLNQPLYASICFGVVPAFMAKDVAVRPPTNVHTAYRRLNAVLELDRHVPNLRISYADKEQFISERRALTDVVIFTGTPKNGEIIRRKIQPPLFILNGAGHNPIVVTESANISDAVESTLRVTLQNQGQDCGAANAILVHTSILEDFEALLIERLRKIEPFVGPCDNRRNVVGPNTEPEHVLKIASLFLDNRRFRVYGGMLNPATSLIYPTAFRKPLSSGPNFTELFAPVIMIHPYAGDTDLSLYFEHPQYYPHAMYVTVFGYSAYVESLIEKGLHTRDNILYNTDLHHEEHGFLPYGGLGPAASCLYTGGHRIPGATLPQRDIYLHLISPAVLEDDQGVGSLTANNVPSSVDIGGR